MADVVYFRSCRENDAPTLAFTNLPLYAFTCDPLFGERRTSVEGSKYTL